MLLAVPLDGSLPLPMVASHEAGSLAGHVAPQCQSPSISCPSGQPTRDTASARNTVLIRAGGAAFHLEATAFGGRTAVTLEDLSKVVLGIFARVLLVWAITDGGGEVLLVLGEARGQ